MPQLSTSDSLSSERDLDLSLIPDLHAYLENHQPFQCTTIQVLSGGSGNFAFRLHLKERFEGRPSLVLKHAKNYVASARDIPFGLERQVSASSRILFIGEVFSVESSCSRSSR
jgi:hypothetical protein